MTQAGTAASEADHVDNGWLRDTEAALTALGDDGSAMVLLRPVIPAGYDELTAPALAAIDFTHVAALARGDGDLWDPLESTCRHASLSIL